MLISAPRFRRSLQIFSYPRSIKCLFLTTLFPSAARPATTSAAPPLNSSASTSAPFNLSTPLMYALFLMTSIKFSLLLLFN